jgi:NAD(P)-dependent dehydrogenase (short-subunit alcohol dehydrogenase family)
LGRLDGKAAVITGGLSGIGRQTSVLFAREGASVVVFDARDSSRDDGLAAAELVSCLGADSAFVQGDVRKPEYVDRAFETTIERFGGVLLSLRPSPGGGVFREKSPG